MPRILLAALALACVCSPAMAFGLLPGPHMSGGPLAMVGGMIALCAIVLTLYAPRVGVLVAAFGALIAMTGASIAAECSPVPVTGKDWLVLASFIALAFAYVAFDIWRTKRRADRESREWADFLRKPCWLASITCGAAALLLLGGEPALAETVTVNGQPTVILPWGDQIAALAVAMREPIVTVLLPILAGYIIQAIRKVYPWAALFLTQRRVEMMLEAAVGYGLNAVGGAAKGKTLSVDVAVPVIAKGTQYVIDTAPAAVIKAAGGRDGIAARMFRKLDLDEHGSEATVLAPAVERMDRFPPPTADELRDAERMTRN